MLVRIVGDNAMAAMSIKCEVNWSASYTGQHGKATLTLDPGTELWSLDYVHPEGGTYVEVITAYGMFRGVMDAPVFTPDGATADVMPPSVWLETRLVGFNVTLRALTAGGIARLATLQALAGAGSLGIIPGVFCEGGPIIPVYQLNGQTLLAVLTDLTSKTGQEWEVDEGGRINWQPYSGTYRDFVLVDDGRLLGQDQSPSLRDRSQEVIEQDSKKLVHTAFDGSLPILWPRQTIGSQDS